jgi:RNA polymerase sigma-70 factor (ECF subfamily)
LKTRADEQTHRAIEAVARESYGRLVALLAARTRDIGAAEDALSDALMAALTTWPRDGIPKNPQGWLLTAARNRLTDHARHQHVHDLNAPALKLTMRELHETADPDALPDKRLMLMFVCAHPAIDPDMHTPLMLQTVLGLDAVAIGRALLVAPKTIGQRLVRAKTKIRQTRIVFEIPTADQIDERLDAVLNAIYAAYGNSWEDATAADPRVADLGHEAIWLARVLREQIPDDPEVRGLLALMLHCEARRPARRSAEGRFVPLSEQDPRDWRIEMVEEAEAELAASAHLWRGAQVWRTASALRDRRMGRYQIEAAIQSVHAERALTGRTDWTAIAAFYDQLMQLAPSIGAAVARAAARAEVSGPQAGLTLLDQLEPQPVSYQPYWAVRAHLLQQLDRPEAAGAFDRAIGLSADPAVRDFLLERRQR